MYKTGIGKKAPWAALSHTYASSRIEEKNQIHLVAKSTISGINKKKIGVLNLTGNYTFGTQRRNTLKKRREIRMEKALYNWFVRQRQHNFPVSGDIIKEKAKALHGDIQEKEGGFNASSGWLAGFKSCYGIRLLKVCGEKLSSDQQAVEPFKQKLNDVIRDLQLCRDQIYNADETGLFWKILPEKSYVTSSEKVAPGRKMEKARVTFLACTNVTGEHKIKPLVIGRAKNPRSFKSFKIPVDYRNSKNAWMTSVIFKDWFHTCFVPQVQKFLQLKGLPQKALLLLDNAPCHPPLEQLRTSDGSIFVIFMPPNVTPLIQPMDQNVIRITKLNYRKNLLALAVGKENITQFLKALTLKDALSLLLLARNQLKSDVIEKCWRALLKSTAVEPISNGDDEEEVMTLSALRQKLLTERYEDVHQIQNLLQIINSDTQYTEEDIENWNSIENREPNSGDDVGTFEISDDDDNGETPENTNPISAAEAIKVFDKCIEWAEANTTNFANIQALHCLRDQAVQISVNKPKKQTTITNFFQS